MRDSTQERFRQHVCFLRRQFLQDGDLLFSKIVSKEIVAEVLRKDERSRCCGTLYSPRPIPSLRLCCL